MLAGTKELRNFFYLVGLGVGGGFVLLLDGEVDFFAVDLGITRRFNPEANLPPLDLDHDDFDIVVDRDALTKFSRKN